MSIFSTLKTGLNEMNDAIFAVERAALDASATNRARARFKRASDSGESATNDRMKWARRTSPRLRLRSRAQEETRLVQSPAEHRRRSRESRESPARLCNTAAGRET